MKALILLSLSLTSFFCYGQKFTVEYEVNYEQDLYKYELIMCDSATYWKAGPESPISLLESFFIKKTIDQSIYFSDMIFNKSFYIKDTLNVMHWSFNNAKKVILEQSCNSAKTSFRGRSYTAYYTNNYLISEGPWKFGGLPGLILEVASDDGIYTFKAMKMYNSDCNKSKAISIGRNKFTTWNDFKNKFKNTVDNTVKLLKANIENDQKGFLKISAPEIIYPDAQQGQGIEY